MSDADAAGVSEQCALADPRLAAQHEHSAVPGPRSVEKASEHRARVVPALQRGPDVDASWRNDDALRGITRLRLAAVQPARRARDARRGSLQDTLDR